MSRPAPPGPVSWTAQWHDVLAIDPVARRRLEQGHAWDRSGRVTQVRMNPGLLQGSVQGKAATPYVVRVRLRPFDDAAWDTVLDVLAGQARHHAHLLAGLAPQGLEAQLAERGLTLLPTRDELDTDCPCGDATWPCVHVAAVWDAARTQLDADPFLLFRLRGRGRQRLLADLAERRRGDPDAVGIDVDTLPVQGWTATAADPDEVVPAAAEEETPTPAPLLRLLGDPPGWEGRVSAWDTFAPMIARAAATATGEEGTE
jgi:uncharacterized Zn finger protein